LSSCCWSTKTDVDAKTGDGLTALHMTALRGHEAVVKLLLEKGS
jgi:ankyrin repeat protein